MTTEEQFASATSVFVGHIIRTEEIKGNSNAPDEIEGTFQVVEVLKGQPPADNKIKSRIYGFTNCTIPIVTGFDYLLLLYEDNQVWAPSGSRALSVFDVEDGKLALDRLRQIRDRP